MADILFLGLLTWGCGCLILRQKLTGAQLILQLKPVSPPKEISLTISFDYAMGIPLSWAGIICISWMVRPIKFLFSIFLSQKRIIIGHSRERTAWSGWQHFGACIC